MNNFNRIKEIGARLFSVPWYPLVLAMYPALALLSSNIGQVKLGAAWRSLLVSVLFVALLFGLLTLILRNRFRAAFLSTLLMILFFSYGHVYMLLLEQWEKFDVTPWLLSGWLILAILFGVWATRPKLLFTDTVLSLNVVALALVVTSMVQISSGLHKGSVHTVGAKNAPVEENLVRPENPPDVYYFILDSYGRDDLLKEAYGYDNSAFIAALRERGFYVAECSMSNYVRTELSLGSSLNMSYLPGLDPAFTEGSIKRAVLWNSLKHSAVRYNFETIGYETIGFATGFAWNELHDADLFLEPNSISTGINEFEVLFLKTTLARYVQDLGWFDPDQVMGQNFRDRTMNVFDRMDDIAHMPEPTFAYVHLISPHPPFVFGPNGEPTYPPDFWNENREYPPGPYAKGYQNQLTFLNKKVLEAMDILIAESDTPPIIVLQGDHGPWLQTREKRLRIFNAYYLPGHNDKLYSKITPVNTFRLIFDTYFGGNYDMLPDVSYFSPVPKLYDFSEIPNTCSR